jgi:uncharacterized membrane protein YidH (DUF202 family)
MRNVMGSLLVLTGIVVAVYGMRSARYERDQYRPVIGRNGATLAVRTVFAVVAMALALPGTLLILTG